MNLKNSYDPLQGQFIVLPSECEASDLKKRLNHKSLNENYSIYYKLDLVVSTAVYHNTKVVLAGYAFNPHRTGHSNEDIARELAESCSDIDQLSVRIKPLGGRWTIIASFRGEVYLLSDAMGLSELYYSEKGQIHVAASGPEIMREVLDTDFKNQPYKPLSSDSNELHSGLWWPGDYSPLRNTRLLLPNHYLHLNLSLATRFWPERRIEEKDNPIPTYEIIADLLDAQTRSVKKRHRIDLAFTSGFDSRLNLATLRNHQDSTDFHLIGTKEYFESEQDARDADEILSKIAKNKELRKIPLEQKDPRIDEYISQSSLPRRYFAEFAFSASRGIPKDSIVMTGTTNGICRENFVKYKLPVTVYHLCLQTFMGCTPFAREQFESWLKSARHAARKSGIHIQDLFHWEQRYGRWLSQVRREHAFAYKVYEPFNNREILEHMLSLPHAYRRRNPNGLFEHIIRAKWPELLEFPINGDIYQPLNGRAGENSYYLTQWFINLCKGLGSHVKSTIIGSSS